MSLYFTKMHGLGNDFIVIDGIKQDFKLRPKEIANLAKRDTGIGFDQCLVLETSIEPGIDFFYRIFNASGEEVGQCGNGARCLARFIAHYGLSQKREFKVATKTTKMLLSLEGGDWVRVEFPQPHLDPQLIPLMVAKKKKVYELPLKDGQLHPIHALNVGNPHAVSVVKDVSLVNVESMGAEISHHAFFPEQCNAGFMQIVSADELLLRVYERGCGETKACGSGAVAAFAVARLFYQVKPKARVQLQGGELELSWKDIKGPISLLGPASFVYEGRLFT